MSDVNYLDRMFPRLARKTRRVVLGRLPTPVQIARVLHAGQALELTIKLDNLSGSAYGGNKVRKLEYLLRPKTRKNLRRFATFGTVGSNHALATAIYCKELGYECTCFLSHQKKIATVAPALALHARLGTEIIRYGGNYAARLKILRENLWNRDVCVIPAGGSSWIGTLGFVDAGLELAAQIDAGEIPLPQRLYVATGTMGTAVGLALGLALARLSTEVQAVRVSDTDICNEQVLRRLMQKTALMMHALDSSVPDDLSRRVRIRLRHAFFAGGYAQSDAKTEAAIKFSREQLGLALEPTYTGKAMAALLSDAVSGGECLFWNTYNSVTHPLSAMAGVDRSAVPAEFRSYMG
jgi:D-cysteine desulfhydrase